MSFLNYHHLKYFHAIALEGTLTGAANALHISQSALSIQLKKLEESLECQLFSREHKSLTLTEEGKMVLEYAKTIFDTGDEMLAMLKNRGDKFKQVVRIGAVATLSRNFQITFLRPLLEDQALEVVVHSASMRELIAELKAHSIDMILSNIAVRRDTELDIHCHLIAEQRVSLVGPPHYKKKRKFKFPEDLRDIPLVLPSLESNIRAQFDLRLEHSGIHPLIAAEVDDMAMLRLIARETDAISLLPRVVVKDELDSGQLVELHRIPELKETFYAITATRRFPNKSLERLLREQKI